MQSLDIIGALVQVTNTEGVSYQVFITSMISLFGSFIVILGILINILNTRSIASDTNINTKFTASTKAVEDGFKSVSGQFDTVSGKFDLVLEELRLLKTDNFIIKDKLNVTTVAEKPIIEDIT